MPVPHVLLEIISEDVNLSSAEPGIYSVYSIGDTPGSYDSVGASTIYDVVACNRIYNWLMWGYSIKDYSALCEDILALSSEGWVLDLACGSLAFTAKIYENCSNRPIVFLDQSLKLLRKGKSRLEKLMGNISENMLMAGITYKDTFFVSHLHQTESLYFHELVHVIQWERLDFYNFLLAYGVGLIQFGYRDCPLERIAYSLQSSFDRGILPENIINIIQQRTDAIWNGVSSMLSKA
jgi:hypothetical protein